MEILGILRKHPKTSIFRSAPSVLQLAVRMSKKYQYFADNLLTFQDILPKVIETGLGSPVHVTEVSAPIAYALTLAKHSNTCLLYSWITQIVSYSKS
jgi:hypothetical protein